MKVLGRQLWKRLRKFVAIYLLRPLQIFIVGRTVELISGQLDLSYESNELILLCLVRNGELYIPSFMQHYEKLGVKHIVLLDNGSTDQTVSLAQQYPNVTILRSLLPFKWYKMAMRHYLIHRFAQRGRWVLYVDIDELFDYPFSDRITLSKLLEYMNAHSYTSVVAHMLDMFSAVPLELLRSSPDDNLEDVHKYYDLTDIVKMKYYFPHNDVSNEATQVYFGGIRKTLFSPKESAPFNILTKHPLFFLDGKIKPLFIDEHDVRGGRIADFTCVLMHYKFLSDFRERVIQNVKEENYYNNSEIYKICLNKLEKEPNLIIKQETSQLLNSVNDLLRDDFLIVSKNYIKWIEQFCQEKLPI